MTMNKFGCTFPRISPEQITNDSTKDLDVVRSGITFPGKDVLENAIEDSCQQLSELHKQLRETHELHEEQKLNFLQSIIKLQTKLQEGHVEKDALSDLRLKENRKQADVMGEMQAMMRKLQASKQAAEQRLLEAEDEAESHARRAEAHERTLQEVYSTLLAYDKPSGNSSYTNPVTLCDTVEKVLQDLEHDNNNLRERLVQVEDQMKTQEQKWQENAEILLKEQKDRKPDQSQVSVYQRQINDMESALSILRTDLLDVQRKHEVKVGDLEKQLAEAQYEVEEAQRGRDQSLQQAEEMVAHLGQLTSELGQVSEELALVKDQARQQATGHRMKTDRELEEQCLEVQHLEFLVKSLKGDHQAQMEVQEQQAELAVLRGELELKTDQLKELQALLDKRNRELQVVQREWARVEEAQTCGQALRAETELLKMKLEDKERVVDLLQLQIKNTTKVTEQHGHNEKSHLINQLNEHKLEIQQLKTGVEQRELRLSVLELERQVQRAHPCKQSLCVRELTLEKQQLSAELEEHRRQLVRLKEEQGEFMKLQVNKSEEQQGVVVRLKAQLKTTRAELDQAKKTLRALEGADGHGLKVAQGMQKQITARREQIDTLQGRIQVLEDTMDKLTQEKRYQSLEIKHLVQELASVSEEKRRLAVEVETVRSLEKPLREKIAKLEAALHKMSESFVNCQDFIQLQEQEFVRQKLQHALDIKELQGQNLRAAGSFQRASMSSPTALRTQHDTKGLRESQGQQLLDRPALELQSLVKDPGTNTCSSITRSIDGANNVSSIPENANRTYSSSVPQTFRTTDLDKQNLNFTLSTNSHDISVAASLPFYTTSTPGAMPLGRRSPVHSLLTSDPRTGPHSWHQTACPLTDPPKCKLTGTLQGQHF
ncbi:hypothetical protein UPYG_G00187530 [Umbra pygmaea]|uniref:Coiled-coil domain-containing protein 158 n=1 Tax=Umbra pygmaea TaxID=75934 RepID=A0ABD0XEV9_UMBPY